MYTEFSVTGQRVKCAAAVLMPGAAKARRHG
jgi:hypothetical protein